MTEQRQGTSDRFVETSYDRNAEGEVIDYFAHIDPEAYTIEPDPNRSYLSGLGRGVVLEIGCGVAGDFLHLVGPDTERFLCSDCSATALRTVARNADARGVRGLSLLGASTYELPLKACSVDTVVAMYVIEHIRRPERLLEEVARVLKPGGRLLLSTDTRSVHTFAYVAKFTGLFLKFWRILPVYRYLAERHVSLYTPAEMRADLETHGLAVESMDFWYPLPGLLRGRPTRIAFFPERLSLGMWVVARKP